MTNIEIAGIITAALGGLFSKNVWDYFRLKAKINSDEDGVLRGDCKERIEKLEHQLELSEREKREMNATILDLSIKVAQMQVKIKIIEEHQ